MPITSTESIFQFDEGLIGFYDCKSFLLIEREEIAPFRWLQSTDRADIGFLVIDPSLVVTDYKTVIPSREWESLGLGNPEAGIVLVTCMVGVRKRPKHRKSPGSHSSQLPKKNR